MFWYMPCLCRQSNVELLSQEVLYELNISNHPNPFSDKTTVLYTIPEEGFVDISIYSLQGEKIKTLVSDIVQSGEHQYEFDSGLLPSGVYTLVIQSGELKASTMLMVIK
jgi:hypothetical protein